MRETGKSFRILLQTLYVASVQNQDVILWVGNHHEVARMHKALLDMAQSYLPQPLMHNRSHILMPNKVRIYVKNIQNVATEIVGYDFRNMQEITDAIDEADKAEFFDYRLRNGLI